MAAIEKIINNTVFVVIGKNIGKAVGFVNNMLIARLFGTTEPYAAFVASDRLTNFFGNFTSEALACLIPVMARQKAKGRVPVYAVFFNYAFIFFFVMIVLAYIFHGEIVHLIGPRDPVRYTGYQAFYAAAPFVFQVMVPLVFLKFWSMYNLNALSVYGNFKLPGFLTSLPGVTILIMLVLTYIKCQHIGVTAMVIGMYAGFLPQALIYQWLLFRHGQGYRLDFSFTQSGMKEVLVLMLPLTIPIALNTANAYVDIFMVNAFSLSKAAAVLSYAQKIFRQSKDVFLVSFVFVLFPTLSALFTKKDTAQFRTMLNKSFSFLLFLVLPMQAGMMLLSRDIIDVLFRGGKFTSADSQAVGQCLFYYALGMFTAPFTALYIKMFYISQKTRYLALIGVVFFLSNISLNFIFLSRGYGAPTVALATSISSVIQAILMHLIFRRYQYHINETHIALSFLRFLLPLSVMLALVQGLRFFSPMITGGAYVKTAFLFLAIAGGAGVYLGTAFILKLDEALQLKKVFIR